MVAVHKIFLAIYYQTLIVIMRFYNYRFNSCCGFTSLLIKSNLVSFSCYQRQHSLFSDNGDEYGKRHVSNFTSTVFGPV